MIQLIDIEIIANTLFKTLLLNSQHSENNIINGLNIKSNEIINILNLEIKKYEKTNKNITDTINNKIEDCIGRFADRQQDQNENLINILNNKFNNLHSFINDNIITTINKFKEDISSCIKYIKKEIEQNNNKREYSKNTKICNHARSRNKGSCKKIISIDKVFCKYHNKSNNKYEEQQKQENNSNIVNSDVVKMKIQDKNVIIENEVGKLEIQNKIKKRVNKDDSNIYINKYTKDIIKEHLKSDIIYNILEYNDNSFCGQRNIRTGLRSCKEKKADGYNKCNYHKQFCDEHNLNFSICRKCRNTLNINYYKKICKFYPNCKFENKCKFKHII